MDVEEHQRRRRGPSQQLRYAYHHLLTQAYLGLSLALKHPVGKTVLQNGARAHTHTPTAPKPALFIFT